MNTILCFGDSNTYGYNPKTGKRFPYDVRWTGILNEKLRPHGKIIAEEGLCGRTTSFDDPNRPYRNGKKALPMILLTHTPVECIVIMLGTNDCKTFYNNTPETIGNGISELIHQVKNFSPDIKIVLISPIHLADGVGEPGFDPDFDENSVEVSKRLKNIYSRIAVQENCIFMAASDYAVPSVTDREHLDENGHMLLAEAVYKILEY